MLQQGYGILPNTILFDDKLSSTSKLLFVLISSLCAEKGYCYANNEYLAERMSLSEETISRRINELSEHLSIENPKNHRRQISLVKNVKAPSQKRQGSLVKNVKHNITSSNSTSNNYKQLDSVESDLKELPRQAQKHASREEISGIIRLFEEETRVKMPKKERNYASNLIKRYGYVNSRAMISLVFEKQSDKFFPRVTTPSQLWNKLPMIAGAMKHEDARNEGEGIFYV